MPPFATSDAPPNCAPHGQIFPRKPTKCNQLASSDIFALEQWRLALRDIRALIVAARLGKPLRRNSCRKGLQVRRNSPCDGNSDVLSRVVDQKEPNAAVAQMACQSLESQGRGRPARRVRRHIPWMKKLAVRCRELRTTEMAAIRLVEHRIATLGALGLRNRRCHFHLAHFEDRGPRRIAGGES